MLFVAGPLRVALASDHVPLFELHNRFTIGLVHQPIDLLDHALREWFGIERPHIGVLGLNPHAGENGTLGDEEHRIIEPALALARNAGLRVSGPLPPDTAFIPDVVRRFDGLVAMYHDQGLIPVKMHAFHSAVNVTLGLGAVRTSPDHGTAFDIAGRNAANPGSMRAAVDLAIDLALARQRQRAAAV
jgi:4-hydroxythreonine-4-phosphate dehydrogenase